MSQLYLDVKYQIEILNLIKEINKKNEMTLIWFIMILIKQSIIVTKTHCNERWENLISRSLRRRNNFQHRQNSLYDMIYQ